MNARIRNYILPYNLRKNYPVVDDKHLTFLRAAQYGLATPHVYYVFQKYGDLGKFSDITQKMDSFVIKPAKGSQGKGILVLDRLSDGRFINPAGKIYEPDHLHYHIAQIMAGLYSLSSYPDKAILQYKVLVHQDFALKQTSGVPDIRIIVFAGHPVMAMMRVPTLRSGGKANLHQGAVGLGIDLVTGRTTNAILKNSYIDYHPDTGLNLHNLQVPFWDQLLLMAGRCYEFSGLGYIGVDIVIDQKYGPLLLEMNARPGLSIQLANRQGLETLLRYYQKHHKQTTDPQKRIAHSLKMWQQATLKK